MNFPNRDWKLPLPPSYFDEEGREPDPLPTPPAAPRALQVVRTPAELTNPTPSMRPRPLELVEPETAVSQRAALFRWAVLLALTVANTLFTLAQLYRH